GLLGEHGGVLEAGGGHRRIVGARERARRTAPPAGDALATLAAPTDHSYHRRRAEAKKRAPPKKEAGPTGGPAAVLQWLLRLQVERRVGLVLTVAERVVERAHDLDVLFVEVVGVLGRGDLHVAGGVVLRQVLRRQQDVTQLLQALQHAHAGVEA